MSWKLKIFILILVFVITWIVVAPLLANRLIVEEPLGKADAIMVLSGSSVFVERTNRAAEAYKRGVSRLVLLTDDGGHAGWSKVEQRNPKFVELAEQELIRQGVAPKDIRVLDAEITGTIYEAKAIADEIKARHWKSILLVTSAYHTKRTVKTFEREIADKSVKIGVVSYPPGWQTPSPMTWWFSPQGWTMVGGEYLKSLYYWVYY